MQDGGARREPNLKMILLTISSIGLSLGAARRLSALENMPISQFFCEGQETSAW